MIRRILKRLWRRLCHRRTMKIYGESYSGETRLYCGLPDGATIRDSDSVEWQQMRDRVFNAPKGGPSHD